MDKIVRALQSIELFRELPKPLLEQLAAFSLIREVKAGETIFCQGEGSAYCYGVLSGEVLIQRVAKDPGFPPKVLNIVKPGSLFGESALFEEKPRMAMASAKRDGALIALVGAQFRNWIKNDIEFGVPLIMNLLQTSLGYLRQTSTELSVVYGVGRMLSSPKPYGDRMSETIEFVRSSLEGVEEVVLYQRNPYWDEYEPVIRLPNETIASALPVSSVLVAFAHGTPGAMALRTTEQRQALSAMGVHWSGQEAAVLVPIREEAKSPLEGFMVLGSSNPSAFSTNALLLLTAVSVQLMEAMLRQRRQDDVAAQSRLKQSRQSYPI